MKPTVFNYADHIALQAELARVTAERDRAVADIHSMDTAYRCPICKWYKPPKDASKPDYFGECTEPTGMKCTLRNKKEPFEWRGTDKGAT